MRRSASHIWPAFVALLTVAARLSASGELKPIVAVTGDVPNPAAYSLEQLQKLPAVTVTARDHGGAEAQYTGVALGELLRRAGVPLGDRLRGAALTKAVIIHAADGYQALFSIAELDPAMTDRPTILAWDRDNEPLPPAQGPLRLVVPGEKRQARWVRQVTAIEVISRNRPAITNATMIPPASP